LSPEEVKAQKMLDAVIYAARVLDTNLVVEPEIKLSASAGVKDKSTSPTSVILPNVSASISVGSNQPPPSVSGAKTNSP
jgi:hypothetical protein